MASTGATQGDAGRRATQGDELGFHRCYDFLNFPVDRLSGLSVGYCFVNFVTEEFLRRAMQVGGEADSFE